MALKPVWVGLGIAACLVAGATMKKCLTCAPGTSVAGPAAPPPRGERLDAPLSIVKSPPPAEEPPPAAPSPPEAPEAPATPIEPPAAGGAVTVTFEQLASYTYVFPEVGAKEHKDQIPPSIKTLDGTKVALQGFMTPIKVEGDDVVEFLLVRFPFGCCFSTVPKMNEWAHVTMSPGKRAGFTIHIPVVVTGTLEVGEKIEDGIVVSVYRLRADDVSEPPTFR